MTTLIPWMTTALVGIGGFLATMTVMDVLVDILTGIAQYARRKLRPQLIRRLEDMQVGVSWQEAAGEENINKRSLLMLLLENRPVWIAAGLLLALLVSDPMLSPGFVILLPVAIELYRTQKQRSVRHQMDEDISNLITQVEARYPITHSLYRTLVDASAVIPDGLVSKALELCIRRLQMNAELQEALEPLTRLNHPALNRLASVLSHAQDTRQDIFLDTLRMLREDAESRMDLRRHARRSLTIVLITTRVLQVVILIAFVVVSTLPAWRSYYIGSPKAWVGMVISLLVTAIGSLYVEMEMRQMEGAF